MKRIGRKKKNCVGQLKTDDGMTIAELSSKEIQNGLFYTVGRAKNRTEKTFIQLQDWTDTRSISHQHAEISYDQNSGLFIFKNLGRNGSTVNDISLGKEASQPLTNNSIITIGGYKMKFVYNQ